MSLDLVDSVFYLSSKGENEPAERFTKWLKDAEDISAVEFIIENEKYYWKIVSSIEFKDIIDEDLTDWFLIYSESRNFMIISKKRDTATNLIDEKVASYITTIWILKSNIDSIKVDKTPIMIWTPHHFCSPIYRINYDFKQLIIKLRNPKIKLSQFVNHKIARYGTIRIR